MARQDQDIVFRRVRGRIIPIRRKKGASKRKKQALEGTAIIGLGGLVAAASGFAAGKIFKSGAKAGLESIDLTEGAQLSFDFAHGGTDVGRQAQDLLIGASAKRAKKAARRLNRSRNIFKFGTGALAGAIAGEGVERLVSSAKGSQLNVSEEVVSNIAGVGLVTAGVHGFKSGAGRKLITKLLSKGRL